MQFEQYEAAIKQFLQENYEHLKLVPVGSSKKALEQLFITEVADVNNYVYGIVQQLINDVKQTVARQFDNPKLAYEFGNSLQQQLVVPTFEKIYVDLPASQERETKRQATKNFEQKLKFRQSAAFNQMTLSGTVGVGTFIVGTSLMKLFTSLRLGTVVSIVGITSIAVAGIIYTVIKFRDEQGDVKSVQIPVTESNETTENLQLVVEDVLELRKVEVEAKLLLFIEQAATIYQSLYSNAVKN